MSRDFPTKGNLVKIIHHSSRFSSKILTKENNFIPLNDVIAFKNNYHNYGNPHTGMSCYGSVT